MDGVEEIMSNWKKKVGGLVSEIKRPKGKKIKLDLRGVTPNHLRAIKHKIKAQKKKLGLK